MSKTPELTPIRLVRKDKLYLWPAETPPPALDENKQLALILNRIGDDFVRSVAGLVVLADGEDLLVYGQRTMTVNSLDGGPIYRGRVSIDGKNHRVTTSRIRVQFANGLLGGLEVLKG